MNRLSSDIFNRIQQDFSVTQVDEVIRLLNQYQSNEPDRVYRCILHLSNGSSEKLKYNVEAALRDYRDIIYWAEYDRQGKLINNFAKPFK